MRFGNFTYMLIIALLMIIYSSITMGSEFNQAWKNQNRALVLDGYEFNELNFVEIAKNKRIAAFIHKASDGLPAQYHCKGNKTEKRLCIQTWRRYAIGRELYQTRRTLAKSLGLKWGAYHLARAGNPLEQARHFIDYAEPSDDEVLVIDIEDMDPKKWMSLEDAEIFVRYIYRRLGRWPMLYTNGNTSRFIASNKDKYKILSRLPLWYARYKPDISAHFPKGNWDSYSIWQFQAQLNCTKKSCPYRVNGTHDDIDINVVDMSVQELRAAWPINQMVEDKKQNTAGQVLIVNAQQPDKTKTRSMSLPDYKIYKIYAESRIAAISPPQVDAITTSATSTARFHGSH